MLPFKSGPAACGPGSVLVLSALCLSACTVNLTLPAATTTTTLTTTPPANTTSKPATANASPAVAPVVAASTAAPAKAAPVAAASPSTGQTVITPNSWSEQFSAPDASAFVSPAYAANPADTSKPLYSTAAGALKISDGALTLANARFTVGALGNAATGATTPGGVFAMVGKACTLALNIKSASGTGNFYVYADNNTTSQDSSPHGKASRLVNVGVTSLVEGQNVLRWSLSKSSYTGESFIQLRADSASTVVIDSASMSCS